MIPALVNKISNNLTIIVIVIISILIYIRWQGNSMVNSLLYGWYGADPIFCQQADLDSIILYLDCDHYGYILIKGQDNSILLNESFKYSLYEHFYLFDSIHKEKKYTINFNLECQDFFPSVQILEFTPINQRIRMYNKDTDLTHAILYKNNAVSDMMGLIDNVD